MNQPLPAKDAVVITPYRDGPLLVRGPVRLERPDGTPIEPGRDPVALCRSGEIAAPAVLRRHPQADRVPDALTARTGVYPGALTTR